MMFQPMAPGSTAGNRIFLPSILLFLFFVSFASGSTLREQTKKAYSDYIEQAEKELTQRGNSAENFFRTADSPSIQPGINRGEKVITNLNGDDITPGGIIHDWTGAVFIPGVNLEETVEVLLDYNSHDEIFSEVIASRLKSRSGDSLSVYMRFRKKEIITVVTDTWHEATIHNISGNRAQLFSRSTKINEVKNFGESNETLLPEGDDSGFLWRMNSYWSLEEKDSGVLVECRSITLSRDIPAGLGFIVGPILNRMPRESLESVLETLKAYLVLNFSSDAEPAQ